MLLRSITKHVNDQNWIAIGIDFFIVVVGVFIGIQVANWNEAGAFNDRETQLLSELKNEIENGINITVLKSDSYTQVTDAAERSLLAIANEGQCETDCWLILVDFMHASQWQDLRVIRSTYDDMRRLGLPLNRAIVEKVESFLARNEGSAITLDDLPIYRSKVRQLIPFNVQKYYWENCYSYVNGAEIYSLNCPEVISKSMASQIVQTIIKTPDIKLLLTEWAGNIVLIPSGFDDQNAEALEAIALIEDELKRR
ncbi:MAG: hypothetical protein COA86_07410 [Kangiella sp.]|nr:MAG: hypothetical protein COA86_07410 [Kangiella sp.]